MISRLDRITSRAEQHPEEAFNNLFTLITYDLLEMSFERLERNVRPIGAIHLCLTPNGHSRQKSLLCQHFRLALCDLTFGFGLFVLLPIVDAMPSFEFALQGVLSSSHMRNAPDI